MKALFNFLLAAWVLLTVTACATAASQNATPSPVPAGSRIRGVFQGITPCSDLARPLPQIPENSHCEQMIWNIIFYQDLKTGVPTTYTLNSAYGVPQQGTTGLAGGGTAIEMKGRWTIETGTKKNPDAVVYQLNPENPQTTVSFLKISDAMLHVLSSDRTLLVGNGAWSYTLNRTDDRIPTQASEQPGLCLSLPPGRRCHRRR